MDRPIHIGKASIGWMFNFQSQNDPYHTPPVVWNTYEQVTSWLYKHTVLDRDYVIMNEYDEVVNYDELIDLIAWKQNDEGCKSNKDNFSYARNVNGYRFTDSDFS